MTASFVIIAISAFIILTVLSFYFISRGKYKDMIKPLNKKEHAFFFMLPAGLLFMDMIKYSYSEGDTKLRDKFSELHGDKYALFYLRVHIANKISTVMIFLFVISFICLYINVQSLNAETETPSTAITGNIISKPEFNPDTYKNGNSSVKLQAEITGEDTRLVKPYEIIVPMQIPDDKTCVDLVLEDLEENYIKPNKGYFSNGINSNLDFAHYGAQLCCGVTLETESEQPYLLSGGVLSQPDADISEPPVLRVRLVVSKGDFVRETSGFTVKILPKAFNYKEELDKIVYEINNPDPEAQKNSVIEMPTSLFKADISWSLADASESNNKYIISIGGLFIVVLLFVLMDADVEKNIKKKRACIKHDFPEFVSKFVLLLGCGITTYDSFRKIMEDKKNIEKTFDNHPIYTELETALREIDLGKAEVYAYEDFGLRCRIPEAMKFSSLVIQNLRRGTDDLLVLLREQVSDVWQMHKAEIRRQGEEAGTKLVFPMILSLVSVLLVVIYPVFSSMVI